MDPTANDFTFAQVRAYPLPVELTTAPTGTRAAWVFIQYGIHNIWGAEGPHWQAFRLTDYQEDDGQELTNLRFTRDGQQLVYVRGGDHHANFPATGNLQPNPNSAPTEPELGIWSLPFAPNATPRMLSVGDLPAVSPTGERVAFLRDNQIWAVPLDGSAPAARLFFARGKCADPQWAPDGQTLAFVSDREDHSFIGLYRSATEPIRYLAPSTCRDHTPRWSPDGKQIAFIRTPGDGSQPRLPFELRPDHWSVWVAEVATGLGRCVFRNPATRPGWHPRMEWGPFLEWGADNRLVFRADHEGWSHLYSISTVEQTSVEQAMPLLLTPGDYMVEDAVLSPDRKSVIYTANAGDDAHDIDRRHLWRISINAGMAVDAAAKSAGISPVHELSVVPDVNLEGVVAVEDRIKVTVLETANQEDNPILSTKRADFERAWERVQQAMECGEILIARVTHRVKGGLVVDLGIRGFVPASHVGDGSLMINLDTFVGQSIPLKVIEVDKERRKVVLSNKQAADEERKPTPQQLVTGASLEFSPAVTGDGSALLYISADAQRPPLPAVLPLEMPTAAGVARRLAEDQLPVDFPSGRLVTPQPITVTAADEITCHCQRFERKGTADAAVTGRKPALIFVHGGPVRQLLLGWHNMGYYADAYATCQYFAQLGYVVLAVNYRLGNGYGHDFGHPAEAGAAGAAEYRDILAAGEYLRDDPTVDPARIGIWGGSYGGYLTALALARNSDLFAAGVDFCGVHDWTAAYKDLVAKLQTRVERPDIAQALRVAWESSPVSSISTWRSPVLLIDGDDDRNVEFHQTQDLAMRLHEAGVPAEELIFPDETHTLRCYRNSMRASQALVAFFNRIFGVTQSRE